MSELIKEIECLISKCEERIPTNEQIEKNAMVAYNLNTKKTPYGTIYDMDSYQKAEAAHNKTNDLICQIDTCKKVIEIIKKHESDKWIPVTPDTMPKARYYPPVICCNIEDGWTDATIVNDGGAFINCEGCQIYPTHWQPLPESYKGE